MRSEFSNLQGKESDYEHLDNFFRDSVDCVDWWVHCLPCGRGTHPCVVGNGDYLVSLAFCAWEQSNVTSRASKLDTLLRYGPGDNCSCFLEN